MGSMERKKDLSAISQAEFAQQQTILDIDKWLASEKAKRDLCGSMRWCKYCVRGETYPCAKAQFREKMEDALDEIVDEIIEKERQSKQPSAQETDQTDRILEEEVDEEVALADISEEDESSRRAKAEQGGEAVLRDEGNRKEIPQGYEYVTRYRRSFRSRLIQSGAVQDTYTELKNAIMAYAGIKVRACKNYESYRLGGERIAKFAFAGKTLVLYMALEPLEFENSVYRFEDMSDKRTHRDTPLRIKLGSRRSVRQAKELLSILFRKKDTAEVGCVYTDYHIPYRSDEELIAEGLIQPYRVLQKKKVVGKEK